MSTYQSPPPPHPLGQRREEVERLRKQKGLDEKGFKKKPEPPQEGDEG